MFDCILSVVIIYELPVAVQSQRNLILKLQPHHKEEMFSTSLSFPQDTRFTDGYCTLALEALRFSEELLKT